MPNYCTNCGNKLDGDEIFCTNCGFKIIEDNISNPNNDDYENNQNYNVNQENNNPGIIDKTIEFDNNHPSIVGGLLGKSKLMGKFHDTMGGIQYENTKNGMKSGDRKYFSKIEPVFIEVYDSIDDNLVKALMLAKRSRMGAGGSPLAVIASQVYTPTKSLSHNDAIKYYQNMANSFAVEIDNERKKGNFDEKNSFKEN